jgi:low affinity Fe/Cu permease
MVAFISCVQRRSVNRCSGGFKRSREWNRFLIETLEGWLPFDWHHYGGPDMSDRDVAHLSLSDRFSRAAQWTAQQCGRAHTFIAAIVIIVVWAVCGPAFHYSDTWQLIINTGTTIITFLMVFLIQNTQNRDTTAIQLKLDELIRTNENARNQMLRLEDLTENQIKHLKESFASAVPVEAIRDPLEAAQHGLAEVSEGIKEAKSRLPPPRGSEARDG